MPAPKDSNRRKPPGTKPQSSAGKARLADALRENLRRRKAQDRARSGEAPLGETARDPHKPE